MDLGLNGMNRSAKVVQRGGGVKHGVCRGTRACDTALPALKGFGPGRAAKLYVSRGAERESGAWSTKRVIPAYGKQSLSRINTELRLDALTWC